MPTVSDLKDQARDLEQQGQLHKALAIYRHILKHLEGTPTHLKVLPLYVKVGDLFLKLNQQDDAVGSYQRAADHYAELGSAQRVSALCAKIVRADQQRGQVYIDYSRQLLQHGHVGAACDVLANYAATAGLTKATEALDELTGAPDAEVKPMLQRLLDSMVRGERTSAERVAERVSLQIQRTTDDMAGDLIGVLEAASGSEQELTPHLIDLGIDESSPVTGKPIQTVDTVWRPSEFDVEPAPPVTDLPLPNIGEVEQEEVELAPAWLVPEPATVPRPAAREPFTSTPRPLQRPPPKPSRPARSSFLVVFVAFLIGVICGGALIWAVVLR